MKKALKELIENTEFKRKGKFSNFIIVSNGVYDGFWGKNGYNNILLLGFDAEDKKYYKITDSADVFSIFDFKEIYSFSLEIPSEYGVPRIWFTKPVFIDNTVPISTVTGSFDEGGDKDYILSLEEECENLSEQNRLLTNRIKELENKSID